MSGALLFLFGVGFGALVGGTTSAWLFDARNQREAQFAANDARLPVALREVIISRFDVLDPDLLAECLVAALTMQPEVERTYDELPLGVIYYYARANPATEPHRVILRLLESDKDRLVMRLSFSDEQHTSGSIHDVVMTRDANGKWTGTIVLFGVSTHSRHRPFGLGMADSAEAGDTLASLNGHHVRSTCRDAAQSLYCVVSSSSDTTSNPYAASA
jgi:hypothetical protein